MNYAFIKLFKDIGQFDIKGKPDLLTALKCWFKHILIDTCVDISFKKDQDGTPFFSDWNFKSDSLRSTKELSYEQIIENIRTLPTRGRMVYNLFVIDAASYTQIANKLKVSINTVKHDLIKAGEDLRKLFKLSLVDEHSPGC